MLGSRVSWLSALRTATYFMLSPLENWKWFCQTHQALHLKLNLSLAEVQMASLLQMKVADLKFTNNLASPSRPTMFTRIFQQQPTLKNLGARNSKSWNMNPISQLQAVVSLVTILFTRQSPANCWKCDTKLKSSKKSANSLTWWVHSTPDQLLAFKPAQNDKCL